MVATFLIEIAVPPLFFAPARRLRLAAFYSQVRGPSAIRTQAGMGPRHHPGGPAGDRVAAAGSQEVSWAEGQVSSRQEGVPMGQSTASLEDVRLRSAGA